MAKEDIDKIRQALPKHFENLDDQLLFDEDNYQIIPTDDPGEINYNSEEDYRILEPDRRNPTSDKIIENEIANVDIDDIHAQAPSEKEINTFGGHAGGLIKNPNGPTGKTTPIDALAFYLPYHSYSNYWGIYLLPEGIITIMIEMKDFFKNYNISRLDQVNICKSILYHHEFYHHKVESFGTRLEAVLNQPCYLKGFTPRYNDTALTSDCFEETCANSYTREETLRKIHCNSEFKVALKTAINDWFKKQPDGYKQASYSNSKTWETEYRVKLYEDYLKSCPGIQGHNRPPTNSIESVWNAAGHLDRGIGNVKSKISYLIRKNSPIFKRISIDDLRPVIKVSKLKKKLKKLGIAEFKRQGSNHEIWQPSNVDKSVPISRHDSLDLPIGTLKAILEQLGVTMSVKNFLAM